MPDAGSSLLFERKKIEIAGIELEVHEAGDGPPLLYLYTPAVDFGQRILRCHS